MKSPFVKFSCGCIGISLDRPSEMIVGCTDCLVVYCCDSVGGEGTTFHIRPMEDKKVQEAVPLDEEYALTLIGRLTLIVGMGFQFMDVLHKLDCGNNSVAEYRKL